MDRLLKKRPEKTGLFLKNGIKSLQTVKICDYTERKHVYKYLDCNDKSHVL